MRATPRARIMVAATVLAVAGVLSVLAAPASASVSSGYISGANQWTDDWGDEGPVSSSSYAYGNVAAMWQNILWADGYLAFSGIDCRFGSVTTAATRSWQADRGLTADGVVGPATFTNAQSRLYSSGDAIVYPGVSGRKVTFGIDSSHRWTMFIGADYHLLSYTAATFDVC